MSASAPLLAMRGIGKRFAGVTALQNVDFHVRAGEVHALLGENGAGKSTLIKILTGVHSADQGEIALHGTTIRPSSPKAAEAVGISTVYQEVNLIPALSVAENISLGRQPGRFGFLNWRALRRHAREILARLEIPCDVDAELGTLSVALQQMVAIARALDLDAKLLVLDEPTASLDAKEVAELFSVMRRLREAGMGIVFVTHFLDQVYGMADRITVLRNGSLVGEYTTSQLPRLELVSLMLGRSVTDEIGGRPSARESTQASAEPTPVLEAKGLARGPVVGPIKFALRKGEVTGLAGLLGSGRTETARMLFGIDRPHAGEVQVNGVTCSFRSPRDAAKRGLAFSSEDRKSEGILPHLSVRENLIIALQGKRGGLRPLSTAEQHRLCEHYVRALRIKAANMEMPISQLSGGNQQKVLLARWLAAQPQLIILDEPTRGIDIGAKAEIEQLINQLRADGMAVLLISSEIEELLRNCDRLIVLREGQQVNETGGDLSSSDLMGMMAGASKSHG